MINSYPVNYPEMIIPKSDGVTLSEKKLISLGYNTFLVYCGAGFEDSYKFDVLL